MRILKFLLIVCLLLMISGFEKNRSQPVTYTDVFPIKNSDLKQDESFYVRHQVKNNDVLIECIVQGITFRDINANNKGKIIIYVDGKKREEISSAAFIIKGLSSGTHRLKLEVIKTNDASYNLQKEFYVTIP